MRVCIIFLMSVAFFLDPLLVSAAPVSETLSEERKALIIKALLSETWDREVLKSAEAVRPALLSEQEKLWQGNIPKFDIRFGYLNIDFLAKDAKGGDTKVSLIIDSSGDLLRLRHSLVSAPEYRGGVRFDNRNEKAIHRQLLLGANNSSMFIFAPYWRAGDDLQLLICPRSLEHTAGNDLVLRPEALVPHSLLWGVAGRLKAIMFSGRGAGSISAEIQRSDGVPPAREERDLARGVNPVADLVYQPLAGHAAVPFPSEGNSVETFLMSLTMQLPAGYQRTIVEGLNLWVSQVEIADTWVTVPVGTILTTKAAVAVPEDLRYMHRNKGLKTLLKGGSCSLIVAEKRETKKSYSEK